jgi:hypothetical protein
MKKPYLFLSFFILIISCGPAIKITNYNSKSIKNRFPEPDSIFIPKPKIVSTYSKVGSYPFIHKNGYKSYEITDSKVLKNRDSLFAKELKFYATHSSFYTRQSMYEKFGDWDKNLYIRGKSRPLLIWEKVKLFPDKEKYYYVIAGGSECTTCRVDLKNIYASIIVLDENRNDCLTDKNPNLKKEIINLFSDGIRNLTNSSEFYNKFHD